MTFLLLLSFFLELEPRIGSGSGKVEWGGSFLSWGLGVGAQTFGHSRRSFLSGFEADSLLKNGPDDSENRPELEVSRNHTKGEKKEKEEEKEPSTRSRDRDPMCLYKAGR